MNVSGTINTSVMINKTSMEVNNSNFYIEVTVEDNPNIKSAISTPFRVYSAEFFSQDQTLPDRWYKSVGGKNHSLDCSVLLLDRNRQPITSRNVSLNLILCYENYSEVKDQSILTIVMKSRLNPKGVGYIRFKINQVSRIHQNQKFRVKIEPDQINSDIRPVYTKPIDVLSKPRGGKKTITQSEVNEPENSSPINNIEKKRDREEVIGFDSSQTPPQNNKREKPSIISKKNLPYFLSVLDHLNTLHQEVNERVDR